MELDTTLASNIRIARDKAAYDAACKRLLSEKVILAWILKRCVKEFQGCDVREIAERYIEGEPRISEVSVTPDATGAVIRGLSQENVSPTEGDVFFDIYFSALVPGTEENVQLIINVEAQNKFYPGYPLLKRGVFYGSRMLSAQDGTVFAKAHYEKLRKVYSIWICTNPPKNREYTITRYHIAEENLLGNVHESERNYDLLSVVMVCLGKPDGRDKDSLLKLLSILLSRDTLPDDKKRVLREEFDIPMTLTLEKEVSLMCNLSDGVWEEGMEAGRKQGMEAGRKQGMEAGRKQGMEAGHKQGIVTALKNLVDSMGWTLEQAMNALQIPEANRAEYAARLGK